MKSGPHFTALFVAATALAFASLILLFGLEASPPGAGLASGWVLLAVLLVLVLAVLAVSPTKAVREGRG